LLTRLEGVALNSALVAAGSVASFVNAVFCDSSQALTVTLSTGGAFRRGRNASSDLLTSRVGPGVVTESGLRKLILSSSASRVRPFSSALHLRNSQSVWLTWTRYLWTDVVASTVPALMLASVAICEIRSESFVFRNARYLRARWSRCDLS